MQTDFTNSLHSAPFLLGQVYDTSTRQIDSSVAKTVINFGQPVSLDSNGKTVSALYGSNTGGLSIANAKLAYFGVAIRANYEMSGGVLNTSAGSPAVIVTSGTEQYPIGSQVSVMKMGRVVVKVDTATTGTIGTPVYYDVSAKTIITHTAAPTDGIQIGTLVTAASDGGLAAIQMCKVLINPLI